MVKKGSAMLPFLLYCSMVHSFTYELCETLSIDVEYRGFLEDNKVTILLDSIQYEGIDVLPVIDCLDAFALTGIEDQAIKHFIDLKEYYSED